MATERVEVVVSDRGTRVVRRNLESIGTAARGSEDAVQLLNRALGLVAAYAGLSQLRQMIDTYTNLQNRLRQVTTGTGNLAAVTSELFNIANRTRTAYEGTAQLYARVALATKEMGVSQQELLSFTERVNQAIILSGASAQEASAGLIQFSQGLASGVLRGDELRSVLEQLPAVADIIAKHLKVTRGELRQLGADGKITTDIILAAFRNADNVAAAFVETIPTLGQAMQVVRNQFIRLLGELDKTLGLTESLARLIISISADMDTWAASILGLAAALAVLAGPAALGAVLRVLRALWALLARNPIGILVAAAAGAIVAFGQLDDSMDETLKKIGYVATAGDKLAATWAGVKAYIQSAWDNFPEWLASLFIRAINGAIVAAAEGLNKFGDLLDRITGREGTGRIDISSLNLVPEPERFAVAGDAAAAAYREAFNKSLTETANLNRGSVGTEGGDGARGNSPGDSLGAKELQKLQRELDRVIDQADPTASAWRELAKAQDVLNRAWGRGLITLEEYNELNGRVYRSLEDQLFPIQAYIRDLQRQQDLLALDAQARERGNALYQLETQLRRRLTDEERKQLDAELKLTQARQLQADMLDQIKGPQEEYYRRTEALLDLMGSGAISTQEYRNGLLQSELEYLQAFPTVANTYKAGLLEIQNQQNMLNDALQENVLTLDQFNARMAQTAVLTAQLNLTTAEGDIGDIFTASLGRLIEGFEGTAQAISTIMGDLWSNLSTGFADSIGQAIVYSEDLSTALKDVARNALSQLISALVQLGIQWIASQVLASSLAAASVATTATVATAAATAWAPAAALASLATLGTNAAPASAALIETTGLSQALALFSGAGFQDGGWTGNMARNAVAGLVHGQEFVVNADAAARNRPMLEALNRGDEPDAYGTGGWSGDLIFINETGVEMQAEARQLSTGDVEVIARRVTREESPLAVARDIRDPNGPVRKSLNANTNIQSKRNGNA